MYMALKTGTSFESEVHQMSDLKHEVIAKRWAELIEERMASGMTIKEWCHERGIKESQYYYWLKILRRNEAERMQHGQPASRFVELPAISQEQAIKQSDPAAILRKGNVVIEVTESASAEFIAKVMEAAAHAW